jgi:membrane associated rhomboid family serine protease
VKREPILNVPAVIVMLLVVLGVIHAVRMVVLSPDTDRLLLWTFAFVPARYEASLLPQGLLPGGAGAEIWSFVTYALIHADLTHLGFNAIWLLAFGSPVAQRFGTVRFVAFFVVTVAAGALIHLLAHPGALSPMIGASAAISGTMGAATRFVFQAGGPLDRWRPEWGDAAVHVPAAPLWVALRNPRVLIFLGVWFGLNLLFGLGAVSIFGDEHTVAWEAHVGGFLAGLLLFSAFDPPLPPQPMDEAADPLWR